MRTLEIAELLTSPLQGDPDVEITCVAKLDTAGAGDLAFVENASEPVTSTAGCLIVPANFNRSWRGPLIKVLNPRLAFARVAAVLHPLKRSAASIHFTAVVEPTAKLAELVSLGAFVSIGEYASIGARTRIGDGVRIGDNVHIGKDCVVHPNVVIGDRCQIGDSVILHAAVVIGADGFGYVRGDEGYVKFPQIGSVSIGDDVEIGANTCIDRGALGETRIGRGTKIDNLVQVAHNVQIGERVIIAAQTGISGSTVIEDDCVIGGQVGMGDHALIKSGTVIGSQAGVLPGKIVRPGVWWGTPVQPLDECKKQNARVKGLGRLKDEVKELRRQIDELKSRSKAGQ